ncbi:ATP-binding protein [Roseimaritima sediminicola]|uniref:ATP-binding protein n=1 Tax=Roseimaritima sediminicola TaxID=2662066 RepID=UPI00129829FD|nr:ATP-binding protein [Roseimaritima sediminicola]
MNPLSILRSCWPEGSLREATRQKLVMRQLSLHTRADRMFRVILLLQWVAGVVVALWVSPRTWIGAQSMVHAHVIFAIVGGGLLASLPLAMIAWRPGRLSTRLCIAVAQALFSCLLIHLSGGRIETHFHVFGSLAILAAYRDWRVIALASLVVAGDHFLRGVWWSESVFGITTASRWRWVEHTAWVAFEDVFLFIIIRQSNVEMRQSANLLTDLENAKREAELANKSKDDFLVKVSHEIRTPLNGVLGFTEVMQRGGHTAEQQKKFLQTIHRSGQHLLRLINDILDISKMESGHLDCQLGRCRPDKVIDEIVSVLRVRAAEKGIELESCWRTAVPETIETDEMRFSQVLMNLVGNAIKFTEHGTVRLTAGIHRTDEGSILVVEITDTGIGIHPEKLERIFSPFQQADNSITRRFGGTGLGLPISRQLARALGGDVSVESQVGRGSCFRLFIRAGSLDGIALHNPAAPLPEAPQPTSPPANRTDLEGMSILLCEDGEINRELIGWVLTAAGASVSYAENGQQGVDLIEDCVEKPDLVLMDMQMPVMDGYAATQTLRARGIDLPVIALTAHAMSGDEQKCLAAGCSGYLTKPFRLEALLDMIDNTFETTEQAEASWEDCVGA